jgi:hypothetical protein
MKLRTLFPMGVWRGRQAGCNLGFAVGCALAAVATFLVPLASPPARAEEVPVPLNAAAALGWRSLRVVNRYGTEIKGLVGVQSYDPSRRVFVFQAESAATKEIPAASIGAIYFKQHPYRQDLKVEVGDLRRIAITPIREFLYSVKPGDLSIQGGILRLNSRWISDRQQFTSPPERARPSLPADAATTTRVLQIPRRIDVGTERIQVLTEQVSVLEVRNPAAKPAATPTPAR